MQRMRIYHCRKCGNEVWIESKYKKPFVDCRCGKIEKIAEGELFISRGREYLQLLLF